MTPDDAVTSLRKLRAKRERSLDRWNAEERRLLDILHSAGWGYGRIANALGVSKSAIQQRLRATPSAPQTPDEID